MTTTLVKQWLDLDQNPVTRKQIEDLQTANDTKQLETLLSKRISFGTAGLRARMEAGFARMNDVTVLQASIGLASYVDREVPDATSKGVVIGHDHRHNSEQFAKLTALAFVNKGFKVYLFKGLVHTPIVPFAIDALGASCGVMVTASHNPAADNGYKVYWETDARLSLPMILALPPRLTLSLTRPPSLNGTCQSWTSSLRERLSTTEQRCSKSITTT